MGMLLRRPHRLFAVPFVLLVLALVAGCGSESDSGSTDAATAADTTAAATTSNGTTGEAGFKCDEDGAITEADWNKGTKQLPAPPDPAALKGKKIAYIGFGQDNVWSQWMFKAIKCEAEAWGASATFIGPPSFDGQVQFQEVTDLATSKNYDGLVIVPNDSTSITPALKQLVAADVPAVSTLQPAGPDVLAMKNQIPGLTGNVIEDLNVNATAMAEGVVDACADTDPCKVIVVWGARALAFDKVKPPIFDKVIKTHPNIKIVCQTDSGYDKATGQKVTADCLQANPDANVLASQADQATHGSEAAITAAGRTFGLGPDDIKIVSAYATKYGVSQVRAGKWFQTSYNRAQSMGAAATRLVLLDIDGHPAPEDLSFLVQDRDFDDVDNKLTKKVLEAHPEVTGQWDG
jgi:ribose transport system substrate-binding protein